MNYLRSYEYFEAENKLNGDFKKSFQLIKTYYIQAYTEERYEVQYSLKQILNDFLIAQEAGRSPDTIIGPDIKDYAIKTIEEELKHKKNTLYWVTCIVTYVWFFLFIILVNAILSDTNKEYVFIEKMRHMRVYINYARDFLILLAIFVLLDYIRKMITRRLFYRPGLIKSVHIIYIVSIALLSKEYLKYIKRYGNETGLNVPLSLFLVLFIITTTYIIIFIASYRKTKDKKRALLSIEEANIEQVICPSCGHVHDIDYPKCPKCGYSNQ
jgi:DNA-binding ferritin-like protein (Dps family)